MEILTAFRTNADPVEMEEEFEWQGKKFRRRYLLIDLVFVRNCLSDELIERVREDLRG